MYSMKPALYDRVHEIRVRCLIREYPMLSVDEVGRVYAETRLSVERNTHCRDMRPINITTAIAKSKLEEIKSGLEEKLIFAK